MLTVANPHSPEMQAFARNFRRARRGLQLSQRAVAERTGVAQSHVSEIEHGLVDPRVGTLVRLARLVRVPLAELFVPTDPDAGQGGEVGSGPELSHLPSEDRGERA